MHDLGQPYGFTRFERLANFGVFEDMAEYLGDSHGHHWKAEFEDIEVIAQHKWMLNIAKGSDFYIFALNKLITYIENSYCSFILVGVAILRSRKNGKRERFVG